MAPQHADSHQVFSKQTKLFSGKLGKYPHKKIDLELLPGAKLVHGRPYPIPHNHLEVFRNELDHLIKFGVHSRIEATKWALPTFIITKKDGSVRWISDFRELDKIIRRKIYPLPHIQDILKKRPECKYFTKIDNIMHTDHNNLTFTSAVNDHVI
jgi:hypothetical protein